MGVLNWSPEGHDDDLFMLQLAADADAWVVSNDTYANHRHLHTGLRRAATQPRSHPCRPHHLAGSTIDASRPSFGPREPLTYISTTVR